MNRVEANNDSLFDPTLMSDDERFEFTVTLAEELARFVTAGESSVFNAIADKVIEEKNLARRRELEALFNVCEKAVLYGFMKGGIKQ